MGNVLSESILYTTIAIESDSGTRGTGFLVADTAHDIGEYGHVETTWDVPQTKAYLVTAAHILGNRSCLESTLQCTLTYSGLPSDGFTARSKPFALTQDPPNWSLHDDPSVDVLALDVTAWIKDVDDGYFRFWPLSEIANPINMELAQSDAGDRAFVLGYPLELRQGSTNLPIIRQGAVATSPRRALTDPKTGVDLQGLLLDGAIMPGSSGSPVVITSERYLPGDLQQTPYRPLIVGLVAQEWGRTEFERLTVKSGNSAQIGSYANLGFIHSGATIMETIALLGHQSVHDFLRIDHDNHWAPETGIPEWQLKPPWPPVDARRLWAIALRLQRDRARAIGTPILFDTNADAVDILGDVPASPQNAQDIGDVVDALRKNQT